MAQNHIYCELQKRGFAFSCPEHKDGSVQLIDDTDWLYELLSEHGGFKGMEGPEINGVYGFWFEDTDDTNEQLIEFIKKCVRQVGWS